MSYIINYLSFEMYIFILILAIVVSVYGIYDMQKKHTGHPMIWILPFNILLCLSLILYRCAFELTINQVFQTATSISTIVFSICFLLSFIVAFVIACKNNYIDNEKLKKILPLLIGCIVIMLICFVPLFFRR